MKKQSNNPRLSDRDMTALMNELAALGGTAVPNIIASRFGIDKELATNLIKRVAQRSAKE